MASVTKSPGPAGKKGEEWVVLQRKLFTRWCAQKCTRRPELGFTDVVHDISGGVALIALLEELSEKKFDGKAPKAGVLNRIQKIEVMNQALKFCFGPCNVQMKIKPLAETLVDGDEREIMALVWMIMLQFIRIGDDDDEAANKLNPKDALLMWVNNKISSYGLKVEGFRKDFHSGMALCAVIHKHRPKLIPNFQSLKPEDGLANLEIAQNAAAQYWGLEKYITPREIQLLDENSLFVFVSEFYYGIMAQRKLDLAARRITKVIKMTVENDRLKAEFCKTAEEYKVRLLKVEALLGDRTIDNTMAGAKKRIADFYNYKGVDKNALLAAQLHLEALFNNLAMRLSHHKRPEFVPAAGCSLKDVAAALQHLEQAEKERNVALHAELNRQIRLAQIAEQQKAKSETLGNWAAEKKAYLQKKEICDSISAAQLQLRLLDAFDLERASVEKTALAELIAMGKELATEKFEFISEIAAREKAVTDQFPVLVDLSSKKRPVLEDDLAREIFRQKVLLQVEEHTKKFEILSSWIKESTDYLNARELVKTVAEANTQISLLDAFDKEMASTNETSVKELNKLGEEIKAALYKTQYSSWEYADKPGITARHDKVDAEFGTMGKLSEEKHRVLADHLAREELSEKLHIMNQQHKDQYSTIENWILAKEAYLNKFEVITSVEASRTLLFILAAYEQEKIETHDNKVVSLNKLGAEIFAAGHSSKYSTYKFDHDTTQQPQYDRHDPAAKEDITKREAFVAQKWVELSGLSAQMKKVLEDHLAREEMAEKTRALNNNFVNKFAQLSKWITKSEAYLKSREHVHTATEAHSQLTLLDLFTKEKQRMTEVRLAELLALGKEILERKYQTEFSSFILEHSTTKFPQFTAEKAEVRHTLEASLAEVTSKWELLAKLMESKKQRLEDHLAREVYADQTRTIAQSHGDLYGKLSSWAVEKKNYLQAREVIKSIADASSGLELLDAFDREFATVVSGDVAEFNRIGEELFARKFASKFSTYTYEHTKYSEPDFELEKPEMRKESENFKKDITDFCKVLKDLSDEKRAVLNDHLARERYAAEARMQGQRHRDIFDKTLAPWLAAKDSYLQTKEDIHSVPAAKTHITLLEQYNSESAAMVKSVCATFTALGQTILGLKYTSKFGEYVFEHTHYTQPIYDNEVAELKAGLLSREEELKAKLSTLAGLAEEKGRVLDDHLKRELFAQELRKQDQQHAKISGKLQAWVKAKEEYLKDRPKIDCIADAKKHLALGEAFDEEKESMTTSVVSSLKKLADEILAQKYQSKYTKFSCENPAEVSGRVEAASKAWVELDKLRAEQKADLEKSLALEEEKERLRLEFAHLSGEFSRFTKDTSNNLAIESFGFTLEEVQEHGKSVKESGASLAAKADAEHKEIIGVDEKMKKVGVKENVYCTLTLVDIAKIRKALSDAVASRDAAYHKELDRQVFNDKLCLEFAGAAEPFSKWIMEMKDQITASKASLDEQLALVVNKLASLATDGQKLAHVQEIAGRMEKAGITNIRHTTLTVKDVEVQFEQYKKFLEAKKSMLEQEIEHAKLKGVTAEQYKEIEENFAKFDTDKSGSIDKKELTACLYSLGEERGAKEITEIMKSYGDQKGHITYEGFKTFMIKLLGDTDTKEEIVQSLILINKGKEIGEQALMEQVMPVEDIKYILETAPKAGTGVNCKAWVDSVFAR